MAIIGLNWPFVRRLTRSSWNVPLISKDLTCVRVHVTLRTVTAPAALLFVDEKSVRNLLFLLFEIIIVIINGQDLLRHQTNTKHDHVPLKQRNCSSTASSVYLFLLFFIQLLLSCNDCGTSGSTDFTHVNMWKILFLLFIHPHPPPPINCYQLWPYCDMCTLGNSTILALITLYSLFIWSGAGRGVGGRFFAGGWQQHWFTNLLISCWGTGCIFNETWGHLISPHPLPHFTAAAFV